MARLPWFRCYPEKLLNALAAMPPDQQLVYVIMILRVYERGGPVADTIDAIATRCRMNRRRVSEALDALFRAGKLARVEGGISNPFADVELRKQREISDARKRAGAAGAFSTNEKRKEIQGPEVGKRRANVQQTLSLSLPTGDSGTQGVEAERSSRIWDFDAFWRQYPHKVGKGAARKEFDRAMKKKCVTFPDVMLGLARYAAKTDDRPWCNPSTWLHQERWLDQPAIGGVNGGQRQGSILDAFGRISGALDEAENDALRDGPVRRLPAGPVRGP